MIPTSYRSKLPQALSYPVGAEAVSAALRGVPQEAALSLHFADRPTVFASEFKALRAEAIPYPILAATFSYLPAGLKGSNYGLAQGWHDETWSLTVYPVPRRLRSVAKERLLSEGLPHIRDWLATDRPHTWRIGRKTCEICFVENDGTVFSREGGHS